MYLELFFQDSKKFPINSKVDVRFNFYLDIPISLNIVFPYTLSSIIHDGLDLFMQRIL